MRDEYEVVAGGGLLSDLSAVVGGFEWRWNRRPRWNHGASRLSEWRAGLARHRCDLVESDQSVAVQGLGLRRQRLLRSASGLRRRRGLRSAGQRSASPRHPRDRRPGAESYFGSASMVHRIAIVEKQSEARLVHLGAGDPRQGAE